MRAVFRWIAYFLLALSVSAAFAQDELRLFQAEDVFELEYASDPQISPAGGRIVYERRSNDIMTDSTRSNLWLLDSGGDNHRPIVSGAVSATSPRWSPDGARIAYVQSGESGSEIMVRWMDTGQTARLASLRQSPSTLGWSPDGLSLAFTMEVKAELEPLAPPRKGPEGSEWSEPVKVFDAVRYKRDGQGFVETAFRHVFVLPADGGTPRQVTSGDFNHYGPLSWSSDGAQIFFSANRNQDWEYEAVESDIYAVSVADGDLTQITDKAGGESQPALSADGSRIAYVYDSGQKVMYRNRILRVMDANGENDRALTSELDRSVGNIQWAGRRIYFQYDDRGARKVGRVSLGGDVEVIADDVGGTTIGRPYLSGQYSVAPDNSVAYTRGTPTRPADVVLTKGRDKKVLTSLNDDLLGNRDLGEVHEIRYESSFDGSEIQGWYITPPGYQAGKSYPLILEIHGGPNLAYGPQFSAELQRFAADGYVVFYDNHRGSTGYGEAFAMLLHFKYSSEEDFADHMSGVDELIAQGVADPDQLFITGGSAGGIASAYAIGLTDRFRAAAVAKPVINWVSKVLTADSYIYQIPFQFPGMPWEEYDHYWKRSPLSLVGNVVTPTMLITGEEDQRTPISETEQFYLALKLRKIDSVMVRVPGSFHGIAGRPSRLNAKVDNILAWFARYRDDDGGTAGE
jgi:dipeptidyl aminopeptidase/acylaminoacyl peptidase